ncbi:MAG TPA: hypothetical protein VFQ76_06460 [Longimicrobiaceae bacterium]|nr:hypothetical protein [Longimicrobiaceae bacterium]
MADFDIHTASDSVALPWENGAASSVTEAAAALEAAMDPEDGDEELRGQLRDELMDEELEGHEADEVDEENPADDAPAATYKVKVDGEEQGVTLDELLKGYSRTADYTRKTQAAAEIRRQAEETGLRAVQAALALEQRIEALELGGFAVPEDVRAGYVAAQEFRARAAQEEHQRRLAEESELLLEAVPEWKDEKVRRAEKGELVSFAQSLGYTTEDLAGVADHRLMLVLRDAMRYRQLKTRGKEVVEATRQGAPRTLSPGSRSAHGPDGGQVQRWRAFKQAQARLSRTGSASDAARVLEFMIED